MKTSHLIILTMLTGGVFAEPAMFTSSAIRASLVELYTSEGCSSCPSAERKLNDLVDHDGLWERFVPVAFHVDYWNYIGWTDRFSTPDFSARQRDYSKYWNLRTVYTPCFVVNGAPARSPIHKNGKERAGLLSAMVIGEEITVRFKPETTPTGEPVAWAAPLSGRETTEVKSGENRGRSLEHQFVALDLQTAKMTLDAGVWTTTLPLDRSMNPKALAVWVSNAKGLAPLQATGGWLD